MVIVATIAPFVLVKRRAIDRVLVRHRRADLLTRRGVPQPQRVVPRPRQDAPFVLVKRRALDRALVRQRKNLMQRREERETRRGALRDYDWNNARTVAAARETRKL